MIRKPVLVRLEGRGRFIGGLLLGVGLFWLLWLLFFHPAALPIISQWPMSNIAASPLPASIVQSTPLAAAGVVLSAPGKPATISQIQATQLATQAEPDAAAGAQKIDAYYVFLSYTPAAIHSQNTTTFTNQPAWLIWFQRIPQPPTNVAISTQPAHDLYLFVNAQTGNVELTVWA